MFEREKTTFLPFVTSDKGLEDTTVNKFVELVSGFDVDVVANEDVMSVVEIPHWTLMIPPNPPEMYDFYVESTYYERNLDFLHNSCQEKQLTQIQPAVALIYINIWIV